jgi:ligand-binding sensor domain-containing protein/two-component sensor histidine kinase
MWFGTSDGLFSFDGVKFQHYMNENYAIAYTNLKFDSEGRVWCSNFGGQLFYVENDSLKLAINWRNKGDFISDYAINNIPEVLIIGSHKGEIIKYNIHKPEFSEIVYKEKGVKLFSTTVDNEVLYAVFRDSDKHTELGDISIYKAGKMPSEENLQEKYKLSIPSGKWSLFGDQNNLFIYMFNDRGRIVSLSNNKVKEVIPESDLSTYSFNNVAYLKNRIWLLSKKGVSVYDSNGNELLDNAMKGTSASSLFLDKEGNIWVGSLNRGIFIIPNLSFVSERISDNSIAHSTVDESDNIYILDDQGSLYFLEPPYKKSIKLVHEKLEPAPLFYDDKRKCLFIGNLDTYYDCKSRKIVRNSNTFSAVSRFKSSEYLGNGFYINTSYANAILYNVGTKKLPPFQFDIDSNGIIRPYRSYHIGLPADKSGIYIDYIDGLFYYTDDRAPQRIQFNGKEIQAAEIVNDPFDFSGIWLTTKSQELLKVKNGKITEFVELPAMAHRIAVHKDYIFLGSQKGIYRLNKKTNKIDHINETDGWIRGRITSLHIHGDECVVVGNNHVQKIPVNYSTVNEVVPNIYITSVSVEDSVYKPSEYYKFPPESNFITFKFRGLSVRSQKKMKYQYRLVNQSEEWVTTFFDDPEARFLNLGAGEYTFEVRLCNESDICSDVKSIYFSIQLPYYKKWWFVALVALLLGGIIFFVVRSWYKNKAGQEQLKSEQQRLRKEIYKSKIAAIRSQMNPHFMFNALNTIQEFILTNQQDIASEYLADFADLMRMYLDQSNEDNVSLSEEEETLRLYLRLENLRFNGELDFSIVFDPSVNKDGTTIPVMLLQPYIENSIKHGLLHKKGTKRLSIAFTTTADGQLKCTITDNGVGRKASEKINAAKSIGHKSFATGANNHRVDLINQNRDKKIKVDIIDLYEEGVGSGTRVEIFVK